MRRVKAALVPLVGILIVGSGRAQAADQVNTAAQPGISDGPRTTAPGGGRTPIRFPDDIPLKRDGNTRSDPAGRAVRVVVILALLVVAGLVLVRSQRWSASAVSRGGGGFGWRLRRLGWRREPQGALAVLQSTSLTGRVSLHVVRWDAREWLIACADQGVSVIGSRPSEVVQAPASASDPAGPEGGLGSRPAASAEKLG